MHGVSLAIETPSTYLGQPRTTATGCQFCGRLFLCWTKAFWFYGFERALIWHGTNRNYLRKRKWCHCSICGETSSNSEIKQTFHPVSTEITLMNNGSLRRQYLSVTASQAVGNAGSPYPWGRASSVLQRATQTAGKGTEECGAHFQFFFKKPFQSK